MARIKTYGLDSDINAADKVVGTDGTPGDDLGKTKNFSVGSLVSFIGTGGDILTKKVVVTTDELKALHTTSKTLIDVTAGNPKELCQVYSVIVNIDNNNTLNKLTFPNDLNIQPNNSDPASFSNPWKYVIPQATANATMDTWYVPSLTAGLTMFDSDILLTSAGAAVETGTALTTITIWVSYRVFEINA